MRRVAIGIAVMAMAARPAAACSPAACYPGRFVPGDGAHVPANLPGIVWSPLFDEAAETPPDPAMVTLVDADGGAIPLTAHAQGDGSYVLVPATALVAGTHYTLADATPCTRIPEEAMAPVTFTAMDAAPLPGALGETMAAADAVADVQLGGGGPCEIGATITVADVSLVLGADAMPWRDALDYTTFVDGVVFEAGNTIDSAPGPNMRGTHASTDRVFAVCSGGDGTVGSSVGAGAHAVAFHATLANSGIALDATSASVELSCAAPHEPTAPGSDPTTMQPDAAGCVSAAPSTPGWVVLALFAALGLRRKGKR